MLSPDPRLYTANSKLLSDIATNINPITNPVISPVFDTIGGKSSERNTKSSKPNFNADLAHYSISEIELENLKKIDLSYLTLFRKSSRFSNKGYTHFFLSQELDCNESFSDINNTTTSDNTNLEKTPSNSPSINSDSYDAKSNASPSTYNSGTSPSNRSFPPTDSHAIYNLVFSHDGKYMASSGADGLINVWEVITSEMDRHVDIPLDGLGTNTDTNSNLAGNAAGNKTDNLLCLPKKQRRKSFIDTAIDETLNDLSSLLNSPYESRSRKNTTASYDSNLSYGDTYSSPSFNNSTGNYTYNTTGIPSATNPNPHSNSNHNSNSKSKSKTSMYAPVFKSKPVKTFYHDRTVNSLDWSKNNFLLSSSEDGTAKLWHVDRADCLQTYKFDSVVTCAKFHKSDDRFFIASQWNGRIVFLSILEKEIIYEIELKNSITCFELSPDLKRIFVGCDKGFIYAINIDGGFSIEADYQIKKRRNTPRISGMSVFMDTTAACDKSARRMDTDVDAVKILISTNDSKVRLVNYTGKFLEVKYSGYINKSSSICATANEDNTHVISGSEDGWTYLWQMYSDKNTKLESDKKNTFNKTPFDLLNLFKDDKCVIENKYFGSFHTNSSRCNVSKFAPRATSKLLQLSNDPIFDLKLHYSFALRETHVRDLEIDDLSTSIIVAADNSGKIKVFRRDFSRYIRKALHSKRITQYVGKNENTDQNVLSKNPLIIPTYQATKMNIVDTMKSVYNDADGYRGRGENKGIVRPANKFAVESTVPSTAADPDNIPTITIENVQDSNVSRNALGANGNNSTIMDESCVTSNNNTACNSVHNNNDSYNTKGNQPQNSNDTSSLSKYSSSQSYSSNSIQVSDSVKNIDDELKQILLKTPQLGVVHEVKQSQHSNSGTPSFYVDDN